MNPIASFPVRYWTKLKISNFVPMVPYVAALLVMIPRIWFADFGLLDDAVTLRTVKSILESGWGVWDLQTGRSRPIYWLYWVLAEAVAGDNPRIYYLLNTLILILTLWLLQRLIKRIDGTDTHFLITSLVLLFSIPTIESFYTISKSEPIQMVPILLSFHAALSLNKPTRKYQRQLAFLAITIFILIAALVKETTALLLPIACFWLLFSYLLNWRKESRQILWIYASAAALAVGVFLLIRFSLVGVDTSEGYASGYEFTMERLFSSVSRWGAWILYTFPHFIPALIIPFGVRKLRAEVRIQQSLVVLFIWITAWIISFLPWIYVASYYLYPAAFGIALLIAVILSPSVDGSLGKLNRLARLLVWGSIALFLAVQLNTYTAARQQIIVDDVNWTMVEWLGDNLPRASLVYVGLPHGNEYLHEIELHLKDQFDREDLAIFPLSALDGENSGGPPTRSYLLTPSIRNQVLLSPRLGLDEDELGTEQNWVDQTKFRKIHLASFKGTFIPFTLNPPSIFCPMLQALARSGAISEILPTGSIDRYCTETPLIDTRMLEFGWSLEQLAADG